MRDSPALLGVFGEGRGMTEGEAARAPGSPWLVFVFAERAIALFGEARIGA